MECQQVHIVPIFTDRLLPDGNRVMLRDRPARAGDPAGTLRVIEAFFHRPSLQRDPVGVVREYIEATDVIAGDYRRAASRAAAVDVRSRRVTAVLAQPLALAAGALAVLTTGAVIVQEALTIAGTVAGVA